MKKHSTLIPAALCAAMAFAMASCQDDSMEQEILQAAQTQAGAGKENADAGSCSQAGNAIPITFKAGGEFSDCTLQKAAYAEGSHSIIWQEDDHFAVFYASQTGGEGADFAAASISQDKKTCTLEGIIEDNDAYFAAYPYSTACEYSYGAFSNLVIPATQTVDEGQFDPQADVMVAYTTKANSSFAFKHIGSKLGITVPVGIESEEVDVLAIEISCSENIAGTASVNLMTNEGALPEIQQVTNGTKTITLKPKSGSFKQGSTYYACVLPQPAKAGVKYDLKIKFLTEIPNLKTDGKGKMFWCGMASMDRGKYHKLEPPLDKAHKLYTKSDIFQYTTNKMQKKVSDNIFGYDANARPDNTAANVTSIVFDWKDNTKYTWLSTTDPVYTYPDGNIEVYQPNDKEMEFYFLSEKEIYIQGSIARIFESKYFPNLKNITFKNFNTEFVNNMASMFGGNMSTKLEINSNYESLDLSSFDTRNVTNMSDMFVLCIKLTSVNLSGFNTENVTNMGSMFYACASLETVDLTDFETGKVNDMSQMFSNCAALTTIYASNKFDVSNVRYSDQMFNGCEKLPGYSTDKVDHTYAKIGDGGYFTAKP